MSLERRGRGGRWWESGIAATAWLLAAAAAQAQAPWTGLLTRDCTSVDPDLTDKRPLLLGFHWQDASRDPAAPDVLFDETFYRRNQPNGPNPWHVGLDDSGQWGVPANWRLPQRDSSIGDVIVLVRGELWLDSSSVRSAPDMGPVAGQRIGVLDGEAPDVQATDDRHRIRWRPLAQHDGVPDVNGCSRAGAAPGGLVVGYVLWSLSAAHFPSPTASDFLRFGDRSFADLSTLDFTVPDPDGSGGSDLDASDGLVLVNPDGLPDTGDEILDFETCTAGGLSRWYVVQPVVRGSFAYFDGGPTGINDAPSVLRDVNGDAIPDVADILADRRLEFSDGCGGLGLLWEGRIATSPSPGLAPALLLPPACTASAPCSRGSRSGASSAPAVREPSATDVRAAQPLTLRRSGGNLVVGWEETLGEKFGLHVGTLPALHGGTYDHAAYGPCDLGPSPATVSLPPGDAYVLVAAWDETGESSYGRDSRGRERPPSEGCR